MSREITNKILKMMEAGRIRPHELRELVEWCLETMSEAQVRDIAEKAGYIDYEEEGNE